MVLILKKLLKSMAKPPTKQRNNRKDIEFSAQQKTVTTHYSGAVPPPEVLRGINDIVPGAAERLIKLAEDESLHRRSLEQKALDANVSGQSKQLQINERQTELVFKSDFIGQALGFLVCIGCIAASVFLGINDRETLAGVIALIPTAALIRAFVLNKK